MPGYWLRNCLPSELEAFAEAVDAIVLTAVEEVLGVSSDPSTYGTDTNPVVADFMAELLHDHGSRGGYFERGCSDHGAFNTTSSACCRYDHFLNDAQGSASYATAVREAWGRLHAVIAGHLSDADAREMEREPEAASGSLKKLTAFLDHANNSRHQNEPDVFADAFHDHCVYDLGIDVRREVDDMFQQALPLGNTVPMDELNDMMPDT
eukprot:jgi/Tetstr1/461769/TSEL_006857.t1